MTVTTWDRLPGEPNRWYERFETYRLLGPDRSVDAAFRAHAGRQPASPACPDRPPARANRHWYAAVARWRWAERSEAWDAEQRAVIRAHEEARRFDARQRRLERIERLQGDVFAALTTADLSQVTHEQAMSLLPQLRLLFTELLQAERLELGEATERIEQEPPGAVLLQEVERMLGQVYGSGEEGGGTPQRHRGGAEGAEVQRGGGRIAHGRSGCGRGRKPAHRHRGGAGKAERA